MSWLRRAAVFVLLMLIAPWSPNVSGAEDDLTEALDSVRRVGLNGQGHESAVLAMRVLNSASIEQVPDILLGMDGADKLAVNWMRSAVLSIVGRGGELPRGAIEEYYQETSHSQLGRLLAFDLLTEGNEALATKMIPDLIDDPSLPLRAKAVDAYIERAIAESDPIVKMGTLAFTLDKARDVKQIQRIENLLAENGVAVDLGKQLGFLTEWNVAGYFDNQDQAGFDVAYGPEKDLDSIDLESTYDDAKNGTAKWSLHRSGHSLGVMDLNEIIGPVKGVSLYTLTTFDAEESRQAQIRIGTPNATKIWLNGELVMSNEIYHNSNSVDKFVGDVNLKQGKNQILVKVCQNEQTEPWAQDWKFQLRICDENGKAIKPAKPAPTRD